MRIIPTYLSTGLLALLLTACSAQSSEPAATSSGKEASAQTAATYERLSKAAFKEKMQLPNTVLLDVRTAGETSRGIIPGAVLLDYNSADFRARLEALDREKTYLVYCASGVRSQRACQLMQTLGFQQLYELQEGYARWD